MNKFKIFTVKGNVVDLAVVVILGSMLGAIVTSFVNDLVKFTCRKSFFAKNPLKLFVGFQKSVDKKWLKMYFDINTMIITQNK